MVSVECYWNAIVMVNTSPKGCSVSPWLMTWPKHSHITTITTLSLSSLCIDGGVGINYGCGTIEQWPSFNQCKIVYSSMMLTAITSSAAGCSALKTPGEEYFCQWIASQHIWHWRKVSTKSHFPTPATQKNTKDTFIKITTHLKKM